MSSAKLVTTSPFDVSAAERLLKFLEGHGIKDKLIVPLTPDASTRNYFRVPWQKGRAVAAVYPEAFDPDFHPYLDVTRLFLDNAIPVPERARRAEPLRCLSTSPRKRAKVGSERLR